MISKTVRATLAAILLGAAMVAVPVPSYASPEHPTLAEVNAVIDVLRFRGGMQSDPRKAIAAYATDDGRASLDGIGKQMADAGINTGAGWRYLLGTAVFTWTGIAQQNSLVVFYNPWIDSALFTVWQPAGKRRRIVDAAWVPGDLVRKAGAEINPRPFWLRGKGYRPDTLAQSVIVTVKAIETRFGNPALVPKWRDTLGIKDASTYNRLIVPMLALTLDESLLRVKALAVPAKGEGPKFVPLREAAVKLIRAASTTGFAQPLAEAKDTTAPMRKVLARVNPKTMRGFAPVAFVEGIGNVTMFFVSINSADYTISARFVDEGKSYKLAQLEFIPYAATYQAATRPTSSNAQH